MFSAFQSNAFQSSAFQIGLQQTSPQSGGLPERYTYIPAYQRQEAQKQQQIKKQKTELQKVNSVLSEYERQRRVAEESAAVASQKEQVRLLAVQNELLFEITRLLKVKAELMARIKQEEELLVRMIIHRRRLRAFLT